MNEKQLEIQPNRTQVIDTFTFEEIIAGNTIKECVIQTPVGETVGTIQMIDNSSIRLTVNGQVVDIFDPIETGNLHNEFTIEIDGYPVRMSAYWMRSKPTQPIVLLPIQEAIAA